jgi:hypothetical protein
MKKICLLFCLLSGCASYSGTTSRGWNWTSPSNNVSTDRMEVVITVTSKMFEDITGRKIPASAFDKVKDVEFVYYETFCPPDDVFGSGKCMGQVNYEEKKMWVTLRSSCLARTSFAHELIHVFAKSTGIQDNDHDNSLLFEKASGADEDTVEYKAKEQAFVALGCKDIVLF